MCGQNEEPTDGSNEMKQKIDLCGGKCGVMCVCCLLVFVLFVYERWKGKSDAWADLQKMQGMDDRESKKESEPKELSGSAKS